MNLKTGLAVVALGTLAFGLAGCSHDADPAPPPSNGGTSSPAPPPSNGGTSGTPASPPGPKPPANTG